ncbi:hypothetical protein AB1K54_08605 [Microbacterium sp. BWT-B31]|uniref:hypothetical protein n=1 Tax=Microbacterium sp. BWT-B31 TaxID=3232072 RepID=UPI003528A89D
MGPWIWNAIAFALVLIAAGGITWWLAKGCVVTRVGAGGAIVGSLLALGSLLVLLDIDAAMRVSYTLMGLSGVWLLAWALAGGIRGQRIARAEDAEQALGPLRGSADTGRR